MTFDDIAAAIIDAHDVDGKAFTREELIDQLGVLFLAGHETSANVADVGILYSGNAAASR